MSTDRIDSLKCSDTVDGHSNAAIPAAVFDEYCRAVHDLNNSLAAAHIRLELYQFVANQGSNLPHDAVVEVTKAMREVMLTCQAVAARLSATGGDSPRV